jgi:hypothetical protein
MVPLPNPGLSPLVTVQSVDRQQDLVWVQRLASFNSINIQANGSTSLHHPSHVLAEEEEELPLAAAAAPLKGGDGYDRLLEYRCGRYLYHHGRATFLPVPAMPADFATTLHSVAGSRNIKGGWARWQEEEGQQCAAPPHAANAAWRPAGARFLMPTLRALCTLFPAGQLMDDFDRGERRTLYGANELVIPVRSVARLMAEEMIHPFFIFQYASVAIW